jgi:hypothetical protein
VGEVRVKKHVDLRARVRVRLSCLLDEALERALGHAARRAFKHDDTPITAPEALVSRTEENLRSEFWNALDELGVEIE